MTVFTIASESLLEVPLAWVCSSLGLIYPIAGHTLGTEEHQLVGFNQVLQLGVSC